MTLITIILPLLGSLIAGLLGRRIGYQLSGIITTICISISAILSYILYYNIMIKGNTYGLIIGDWFDIGIINISWGFILDELSISLLVPVCTISALVHLYAIGYMSHDPHQQRFFSILSLFTGFMIVLVTGNNYLVLFLGWELIGVASYLLIGHWHTRLAAVKSALSAFLMNKVGDMFLIIGMFVLLFTFGSLDFSTIFSLTSYVNTDLLNIIMICFLIGATAKSAQLGLHHWLLNSMEGLLKNNGNRAFLKFYYMLEHSLNILYLKILGPPFNLLNIGKIQELEQSADNNNSNKDIIDISETLRKIYIHNTLNSNFINWFIGFTEGDGSFITNKTSRKNLEFKITQSSKDAQILFYIKKELGFGSVTKQSIKNNTHHFRIRDEKNLYNIIKIFNGNLRVPYKQEQFKLWLKRYNEYYKKDIKYIENKKEPNLEDAWLCGFTDAEGSFNITILKTLKSIRSSMFLTKYIISQKGNKEFMYNLNKLLKGNITYLKSYDGYNVIVSKRHLSPIIKYFNKYKLLTKKSIIYNTWLKIYNIVKINKELNINEINYINKLINKIRKNKINIYKDIVQKNDI